MTLLSSFLPSSVPPEHICTKASMNRKIQSFHRFCDCNADSCNQCSSTLTEATIFGDKIWKHSFRKHYKETTFGEKIQSHVIWSDFNLFWTISQQIVTNTMVRINGQSMKINASILKFMQGLSPFGNQAASHRLVPMSWSESDNDVRIVRWRINLPFFQCTLFFAFNPTHSFAFPFRFFGNNRETLFSFAMIDEENWGS